MLAGNVEVIVGDSVLTVIGDGLANQIRVSQNEAGNLVVSGDDTTVNGSSSSFVASRSFDYLTLLMEGGNDTATIDGVTLNRNISVYGGNGNDELSGRVGPGERGSRSPIPHPAPCSRRCSTPVAIWTAPIGLTLW